LARLEKSLYWAKELARLSKVEFPLLEPLFNMANGSTVILGTNVIALIVFTIYGEEEEISTIKSRAAC